MALIDSDKDGEIIAAVRAVRAGDVQAFATIVRRFQSSIMTLCVAMLRDRQAAEELRRMSSFRPISGSIRSMSDDR